MGFAVALSGLNAAAKDLQVTGNNVANANTTGFKESRAEFSDVYSASVFGVGKTQAGSGVRVANVAQQFNQGSLNFTNNNLDLAVAGEGFFSMSSDLAASKPTSYTRSGEFKINNQGYVVNNQANYLMSFAPNGTTIKEGFTEGVFSPLKINSTQGAPAGTKNILMSVNLDAQEIRPNPFTGVDITAPSSYNHLSSVTIYDSQGSPHVSSVYYVADKIGDNPETGTPNQWQAFYYIDGIAVNSAADILAGAPAVPGGPLGGVHKPVVVTFDTSGALLTPLGKIDMGPYPSSDIDSSLSVKDFKFSYTFGDSTQFSSAFSVRNLSQDGLPVGTLTGLDIGDDGAVIAQFSNGGVEVLGKVALTRFDNSQGLTKAGDTTWKESLASGEAISGQAGTGNFGLIKSGALEGSTVNLSDQLVHLIISQQAYQANAQVITTEKTIVQTILNV
jgi:flagellar hook protein FlgE